MYKGYRAKVKVTGAKKYPKCLFSLSHNVKSRSAITNTQSREALGGGGFGFGGSDDVTAIFLTWPEVTTRYGVIKWTHSWVVGLRLEGNLVLILNVLSLSTWCTTDIIHSLMDMEFRQRCEDCIIIIINNNNACIFIAQNKLSLVALTADQTNTPLVFRQKSAEKRTQSEYVSWQTVPRIKQSKAKQKRF